MTSICTSNSVYRQHTNNTLGRASDAVKKASMFTIDTLVTIKHQSYICSQPASVNFKASTFATVTANCHKSARVVSEPCATDNGPPPPRPPANHSVSVDSRNCDCLRVPWTSGYQIQMKPSTIGLQGNLFNATNFIPRILRPPFSDLPVRPTVRPATRSSLASPPRRSLLVIPDGGAIEAWLI